MNEKYIERYSNVGLTMNQIQRKAFNKFNRAVYFGEITLDKVKKCFCGSTRLISLSYFDRFGLPFGTQICKDCGLINQNIRISESSMEFFYNEIYWDLIAGKSKNIAFSTPPKIDNSSLYIVESLKSEQARNYVIFEVGCGSGDRIKTLSNHLASLNHSVECFGCDYSDDALQSAADKNITTIKGGFDEIASFGKADILILSHLFEHLPNLNSALEKIDLLCHDDTLVYVELPGILDLKNKKEYMFNYQDYNVLAHTYNFSLATLSNVFAKQNFQLIRGNEFVRSIYKRSLKKVIIKGKDQNCSNIMAALEQAYNRDLEFDKKRNNPLYVYIRDVIKALLGRTRN